MRLPLINRPALLGLCVTLTALAACDDQGVRITTSRSSDDSRGVLKVVDALQCPETLGALTRKGSAQADGSVCIYTGPRGAEVSLHLVKLEDEPVDALLARFEQDLAGGMPRTTAEIARADAEAARADAEAERADAEAQQAEAEIQAEDAAISDAPRRDSAHISGPGVRIDAEGERARVSLPGLRVDADGDKANVRIGGFTIRAKGDSAQVTSSPTTEADQEAVSIQAHNNAAQIRTRAPGDATRQTFLLTDRTPSAAGWRLVGYEARGPRGGPIVVATVRARERNSDGIFEDAKELVTLNVGE
jgi:hypothetical protein